MGKVIGICISEKRGVQKKEVLSANVIEDYGIENDAHAGKWHRQISLLSYEKIEEFRNKGADVELGAFGENIIISGYDLKHLPVGTHFKIGDVELEMTQIGKECHSHCEIYKKMGDCIMPREGVFTKVIKGGVIKKGQEIEMFPPSNTRPMTAAVITLSDKGFKGERKDESGPILVAELKKRGYEIVETMILPDEESVIKHQLCRLSDQRQVNLILTTGGTGFSERDVTPEATMAVATRNAPGIAEVIRQESLKFTKRAMLSRAASVIRNKTLIVNMPGSAKAVGEAMDIIGDVLEHGVYILTGRAKDCGRK